MSRTITLAGYCLFAAGLVGLQLASVVTGRTPTIGEVVSMIVGRRSGRRLLLAGWLWVGWHLFVRSYVV